ncbi:transposase for IS1330 [Yersinia similis]|uniref:Transposase for IS1330 n=1 Tax=Yersinia similis TaxID=367190 RepID=A0A0T9RQ39_9GAMM|nr:transposase for IS1330 [Yersinia similis]CNF72833.1 transposase for IS1330 [Yersinia similis]CNG31642.1 transposase for IS1330 [Yersinia similis]CNI76577.1 transposase for IS1330 [Yersinia similis]
MATIHGQAFLKNAIEFPNHQANSIKSRRVISFLTLAENILRHSPLILMRTALNAVLNHLAKTYRSMVLVY